MKFYEKFPQLQEKAFLIETLTATVFSTMALEDQQVAQPKVQEIILTVLNEQKLKGDQFFAD